jgi:hypothetical protein
MGQHAEELARARANAARARREAILTLKEAFRLDAEIARARAFLAGLDAGEIPGALPPYRPPDPQSRC